MKSTAICCYCGQPVGVVVITPIGIDAVRKGLQPLYIIEAHGTCPKSTPASITEEATPDERSS